MCQTQGSGGGGADAGSQSQVLGPLPIRFWAVVDIHISSSSVENNHNNHNNHNNNAQQGA